MTKEPSKSVATTHKNNKGKRSVSKGLLANSPSIIYRRFAYRMSVPSLKSHRSSTSQGESEFDFIREYYESIKTQEVESHTTLGR